MSQRVTMTDVAGQAGVSVATVSHVINGTRNVSDEVAARVATAISDTGYRRHDLARALKRSRTDSVGLVVADTGHPIFAEMVHGVDEAAQAAGQILLLANTGDDPDREQAVVEALRERRVDGLLIVPAVGSDGVVEALVDEDVPVVVLDRTVDTPVDQVTADSGPALQRLASHLVDVGHRRVAILAGTLDIGVNVDRVQQCVAALVDRGMSEDDVTVLGTTALSTDAVAAATDVLRRHLAASDPADAVITLNAHQTVGALSALEETGRRVPDDLALVAFDDLPLGSLRMSGITCAAQPAAEMGRMALQMLMDRINGEDAAPRTVGLPCALVHRRSCGCDGRATFAASDATPQPADPPAGSPTATRPQTP